MSITANVSKALAQFVRCPAFATGAVLASALALAPAPASSAELRTIDRGDTVTIEFAGRIERNDAMKLQSLVAAQPAGRPLVLRLNSQGGLISEAITIGRLVHQRGIKTEIAGRTSQCISACGLIFLGGRDASTGRPHRVKSAEARLAFHGFRTPAPDRELTLADIQKAMANAQRTILSIADYLSEVGADLEFMSLMLESPDGGIKNLTNDKALALGVHVRIDDTGQVHVPMSSAQPRTASR